MAQFGMAKAMMINMPAVQKELKLTDDQAKAIREWSDGLRTRGESMFRRQAEAGNAANAGNGNGNPAPPDGPQGQPGGMPNPLAMLDMISTITREGESGLAKILDKKQRARLTQIALQMEGVSALARPEVAEAIYLMPEQVEQIQEILAESRTSPADRPFPPNQGDRHGPRARRAEDAGGPPVDEARNTAKRDPSRTAATTKDRPADPVRDDPETKAKRRQADRERMRTEFTKFRDGSDQIQNETATKLLRILTRRQRERFVKLLGEPFDPAKLEGPGGLGRPGDAPAVEAVAAPNADTKKAEAPAPVRSSRLRNSRFGGNPDPKDQ